MSWIVFNISSTVDDGFNKLFIWDLLNAFSSCPGANNVIAGDMSLTLKQFDYDSADIFVRPHIACFDNV